MTEQRAREEKTHGGTNAEMDRPRENGISRFEKQDGGRDV
jgi:hypothetical protein